MQAANTSVTLRNPRAQPLRSYQCQAHDEPKPKPRSQNAALPRTEIRWKHIQMTLRATNDSTDEEWDIHHGVCDVERLSRANICQHLCNQARSHAAAHVQYTGTMYCDTGSVVIMYALRVMFPVIATRHSTKYDQSAAAAHRPRHARGGTSTISQGAVGATAAVDGPSSKAWAPWMPPVPRVEGVVAPYTPGADGAASPWCLPIACLRQLQAPWLTGFMPVNTASHASTRNSHDHAASHTAT